MPLDLRDALLFDHRIEVHVHAAHNRLWVRVSCQVYNDEDDIERLARAIDQLDKASEALEA